MSENNTPAHTGNNLKTPAEQRAMKMILSISPLSPVPLTGADAAYGYGRLLLYGGLTYMARKHKKAAMVFGGATAVSLVTSLSATAWNGAYGRV